MISLDKFNGSCNVLCPKTCEKKTKDVNVKVFDTTTNKNEAKTMKNEKNIFHVLVNENSVVQHVIQSKN